VAKIFKAAPKSSNVGQNSTVTISRLDFNGCGVASYKNKSIFIDGTLPNETVIAKIFEQKSKYFRGKLLEVVTPSEKRVDAECQHFLKCGGCDLQHLVIDEQLSFKQQKVIELFARNNIVLKAENDDQKQALLWQETLSGESWHYRRKARIGVQYNKAGQVTVGFRQRGSNQLVSIKKCMVLNEHLSEIFNPLRKLLDKLSGHNSVGHVEVIFTDVVTVIVRQLVTLSEQDKVYWMAFSESHHCQIMFDYGDKITPITRYEPLTYSLNCQDEKTTNIHFSADDFIQVNHDVNTQMVNQAIDWLALDEKDKVLDLFCGLGNFSLPIAQLVESVTGIEGVDKMVEQAKSNAIENSIQNTQFYQADLNSDWSSHLWATEHYDKALLDPARAGAYQAIEQLVKFNIQTLLYVSCDPTSLAKDSALLLSHGYKIDKISLIDMFSQTKHIETMVLFTQQEK
jgi:23S rRNA (uracil1939-C5)-methyltransferase